jgi:membrane-associated protease RseP (regulator of RpoE activity)
VLLGEPGTTAYDWRFRIGSIPVRVHPMFWLITALMSGGNVEPLQMITWIGVCFVSILVHEMGHALLMKRYGQQPRVVLYGMGGLAISDGGGWARTKLVGFDMRRRWLEQVFISAAGPGAGFLLALAVVVAVYATGGKVLWMEPSLKNPFSVLAVAIGPQFSVMATQLLWVNVAWGVMNLLPVLPLDGGRIASTLLVEQDPYRGQERSQWLSVFVGAFVAIFAFVVWERFYITFLFGYLAAMNYMAMRQRPW